MAKHHKKQEGADVKDEGNKGQQPDVKDEGAPPDVAAPPDAPPAPDAQEGAPPEPPSDPPAAPESWVMTERKLLQVGVRKGEDKVGPFVERVSRWFNVGDPAPEGHEGRPYTRRG